MFHHSVGLDSLKVRSKLCGLTLKINIQKFADSKITEYGHLSTDVPRYSRLEKCFILGVRDSKVTATILDEFNRMIGVRTRYSRPLEEIPTLRYFTQKIVDESKKPLGTAHKEGGLVLRRNDNIPSGSFDGLDEVFFDSQDEEIEEELQSFEFSPSGAAEKEYVQKTREINHRIQHSPEDDQPWLDLLNLQDLLRQFSQGQIESAINQKKIAILEKALGNNPLSKSTLLNLLLIAEKKKGNFTADYFKEISQTFEGVFQRQQAVSSLVFQSHMSFKFERFLDFSATFTRSEISKEIAGLVAILNATFDTNEILLAQEKLVAIFIKTLSI